MKLNIYLLIVALFSTCNLRSQVKMAVTIDDFPLVSMDRSNENHAYVMDNLINNLQNFSAPAIGFVNESKLYEDSVRNEFRIQQLHKWLKNGYKLGNHGFDHMNFDRTDTTTYFADILKGAQITKPICKEYNSQYQFYRHPYLHAGDTYKKEIALEKFLEKNGYKEAPVTIDNAEWIFARAYDMAKSANDLSFQKRIGSAYVSYMIEKSNYFVDKAKQLFGRPINHILLIHANNINADYLDDLLMAFSEQQYEFISLEDALKDPAYAYNDHIGRPWGITWIHRWSRNMEVSSSFYEDEPKCPSFIEEYTGLSE